MNRLLISLILLLTTTLCIQGCFSRKHITKSQSLEKELQNTSWLLFFSIDSSRVDTITFSFGYYNNDSQLLNLLKYSSSSIKEICEFSVLKDTIAFTSYATTLPRTQVSNACENESKLLYKNGSLQYINLNRFCNGIKRQVDLDTLKIRIIKLR